MTLDEAIRHAEEVARENDLSCRLYDRASGYSRSHNEDIRTESAKKCEKCAEEHRQLAEWLRELKRFKKNGGWIPIKTRELTEEEKKHFEEQLEMEVNEIICSPLPEDGQEVLITIYDRVYLDTFCNDWYGSSFENADIEDVKAWMSLPEPYKEDDDGMD